ncbi:solanesyl diphosphate synthase [Synechococcus sp. WC10meta]|jgi:all-trans-nonaprenyl-diphosphate synthase|uniref:solanesyl diphosphate synthase n=1 Tax=Synechococcus sp. WC10meta TaxID=2964537 RepID=UPI0039C28B2F
MTSVLSPFGPVEADLERLRQNLTRLVSAKHPILAMAAEHLFSVGGKGIRPAIVLLIARATTPDGEITPQHWRLAEITEMIHTASLMHDDVIDTATVRRGVSTVNTLFDNRVAVLAGDYLFGQAAWYLANLDNLEVVKLLSKVIMDLPEGEVRQSLTRFDPDVSLEEYLAKSFYKTASLISGSAKAAGLLSGVSPEVADRLFDFGRDLGIAFQIVDDLLDFTGSAETLGKPVGSDLIQGNLTAPVLFALEEFPQMRELILRELAEPQDLQQVLEWVYQSEGIPRSRQLARDYAQRAAEALQVLPDSEARQALLQMVDYVLERPC